MGWNTFVYVEGNPLRWFDNKGLWPFGCPKKDLLNKFDNTIMEFCGDTLTNWMEVGAGLACHVRFPTTSTCEVCCRVSSETGPYAVDTYREQCLTQCGDPSGYCPRFDSYLRTAPDEKRKALEDLMKRLDENVKPGGIFKL